jgi:hypothetical protein
MRRYLVTLGFMAILIGALWKAAEVTGFRPLRETAYVGVLFFAVFGSMAAGRWQSREGQRALESALKELEPEGVLTDWSTERDGRPDYLVVGPGGLVAVTVDHLPQSAFRGRAERRVAASRARTQAAVRWLRDRLSARSAEVRTAVAGSELPVTPVLVLTRRRAQPEYTQDGVKVLNPEDLATFIRTTWAEERLDQPARFHLTRLLRAEGKSVAAGEKKIRARL